MCENVKAELKKDGIGYSEETELGIMIETPAAALISDKLAKEVMQVFKKRGTIETTKPLAAVIEHALDFLPEGSSLEKIEGASHVAYLEEPYYRDFQDFVVGFLGE